MVDTITLWLDTCEAEKAVKALTEQRETIDRHTGETVLRGRLKNLSLKITGQGVLVNGSLGKYYLGDTAYTLNILSYTRALRNDTLKSEIIPALARRLILKIGDLVNRFCFTGSINIYFMHL
jgi:hypothetical protein